MNYQWDWSVVFDNAGLLLRGLLMTVELTLSTLALGLVVGLAVAGLRTSRFRAVRSCAAFYVEAVRTTPALLQLFWVFYGIPYLFHVSLPAFVAGLVALTLNVSAYNAEIFRAGIGSIAPGQRQAALALGMTRVQVARRVILPQALRRVVPPLGSEAVSLFQLTSLVSFIAVPDLMYRGLLLRADTFRSLEVLIAVAVLYLAVGYPLAKFVDYIYRRTRTHEL